MGYCEDLKENWLHYKDTAPYVATFNSFLNSEMVQIIETQENQDKLNLNILYYSYFPAYEGISNYDNDLFHNTWTYVSSL